MGGQEPGGGFVGLPRRRQLRGSRSTGRQPGRCQGEEVPPVRDREEQRQIRVAEPVVAVTVCFTANETPLRCNIGVPETNNPQEENNEQSPASAGAFSRGQNVALTFP